MPRSAARGSTSRRRSAPPPTTRTPPNPPLWRFFLAAAALVALAGSLAFARHRGALDLRVSDRVRGTPTPSAERAAPPPGPAADEAFRATGAWALSSLPGCFVEVERVTGPLAKLRDRFPPVAARLPAGRVLRRGACTVVVGAHDLRVRRGADRLRVPPEAALYERAGRLTLVVVDGARAEVRRYESNARP